jgi:hypothetical protein
MTRRLTRGQEVIRQEVRDQVVRLSRSPRPSLVEVAANPERDGKCGEGSGVTEINPFLQFLFRRHSFQPQEGHIYTAPFLGSTRSTQLQTIQLLCCFSINFHFAHFSASGINSRRLLYYLSKPSNIKHSGRCSWWASVVHATVPSTKLKCPATVFLRHQTTLAASIAGLSLDIASHALKVVG